MLGFCDGGLGLRRAGNVVADVNAVPPLHRSTSMGGVLDTLADRMYVDYHNTGQFSNMPNPICGFDLHHCCDFSLRIVTTVHDFLFSCHSNTLFGAMTRLVYRNSTSTNSGAFGGETRLRGYTDNLTLVFHYSRSRFSQVTLDTP